MAILTQTRRAHTTADEIIHNSYGRSHLMKSACQQADRLGSAAPHGGCSFASSWLSNILPSPLVPLARRRCNGGPILATVDVILIACCDPLSNDFLKLRTLRWGSCLEAAIKNTGQNISSRSEVETVTGSGRKIVWWLHYGMQEMENEQRNIRVLAK